MLHYIRVTAGPYSCQIYQFKTKKEARALERALNRLRPNSTDYGNSRDYFPETHLKNRRASTSPPSLTGRQHATKRGRADDLALTPNVTPSSRSLASTTMTSKPSSTGWSKTSVPHTRRSGLLLPASGTAVGAF